MNRGDFFLLCVQTCLLLQEQDLGFTMTVLQKAAELDDMSYGSEKNIGHAAKDFVEYHQGQSGILSRKKKMPLWLEAWEEGLKNRVQVRVSPTALCHEFWMKAGDAMADSREGRGVPFPRGLEPLVAGQVNGMIVSRAQATQLETWGQSIPGWDQQPFTFEEPTT